MKNLVVIVVALSALVAAASAVPPRRPNARFSSKFARQEQEVPHTIYGPPPDSPPEIYGPPETTTAPAETTTEGATTTERESELFPTKSRITKAGVKKRNEQGSYYIYHPDGRLQKVLVSTKKDARNRAVTAQLKYEDVEPINAPIFTYDPDTLELKRLQV